MTTVFYYLGKFIGYSLARLFVFCTFVIKLPFLIVWWVLVFLFYFIIVNILNMLLGRRITARILGLPDDFNSSPERLQTTPSVDRHNKIRYKKEPKYQPHCYIISGNIQITGVRWARSLFYTGWVVKIYKPSVTTRSRVINGMSSGTTSSSTHEEYTISPSDDKKSVSGGKIGIDWVKIKS